MSILRALAWRAEIKAAACDGEESAGPGFISTAYFELISRNQNSVALDARKSQEGMGHGWEVQTTPSVGGEEHEEPRLSPLCRWLWRRRRRRGITMLLPRLLAEQFAPQTPKSSPPSHLCDKWLRALSW